jgi:hypothetical protein
MKLNNNKFKKAEQREFSLMAGGISAIILIIAILSYTVYLNLRDNSRQMRFENYVLKRQVVELVKDNMSKREQIKKLRQWHRVIMNKKESYLFIQNERKIRFDK